MRTLLLFAPALLLACGGAETKPAPTPAPQPVAKPVAKTDPAAVDTPKRRVLAEMRGLATEMCECRDYACAQRRHRHLGIWLRDIANRYPEDVLDAVEAGVMARFRRLRRCFNKLAPPNKQMADPDQKGSPEAIKMEAMAKQMCACADATCAQGTHVQMMAWVKQHFENGKKRKGTAQNVERWKAAQKRFDDCYISIMNNSATK